MSWVGLGWVGLGLVRLGWVWQIINIMKYYGIFIVRKYKMVDVI